MERSWWAKFIFLIVCTLFAGAYIYPTFSKLNPETSKFPIHQKINLGLDLQGGLYMVLGVDFQKLYKDFLNRQTLSLREQLSKANINTTEVTVVADGAQADDPHVRISYDSSKKEALERILKDEFWVLRKTKDSDGVVELGIAHDQRVQMRDRTLDQSVEVIRNRIDQFGVSEPSIMKQGTDRIIVELPGVNDIQRAKDLIGRTAKLEFKIAQDKKMNLQELYAHIQQAEKDKNITYTPGADFNIYSQEINKALKGKLPEGTVVAFEKVMSPDGQILDKTPYLLEEISQVTGDDLIDARVQMNPETNAPEVLFQLSPAGGTKFSKLTGEHLRERLAIVLDNTVYSAPMIQGQIRDRGSITLGQMSGEQAFKEAQDLAIVLRAGALPAQLDFQEQRVVGSQLGADSIQKGTMAGLLGSLVVFIFMIVYYKVSGLIAVISLIMNILFVLAILVGLEATLTMPGIAGIALTVGIAVDSNVIIYERIRDELMVGKQIIAAVESGFQKALRAILDSNITSAGAAIVLFNFGTGPVKGFAVTLLIGVITTLFSAVFITKLFFEYYVKHLEKSGKEMISI